ncbi:hypothetical protein [Cohnella algarum]|uniref:hypothetical protein n=1 Tax=Cohnella algarum TaxID=2044859 RepID=UPI001967814A|nr:hypothetical protein [Cohnella algarum]MBN2980941.1 hypothetical protein [Cohnella algarum]
MESGEFTAIMGPLGSGNFCFSINLPGGCCGAQAAAPVIWKEIRVLWKSSLRFQIRNQTLSLTFISLFSAAVIFLVSFVAINYELPVHFRSHNREQNGPHAVTSFT